MNVEAPRSFVVPKECEKAAWQNGFRRGLGEQAGWASFGSTTARAKIHLAAAGKNGPWFLALDHAGVVAEMRLPKADMPVPGLARHGFDNLGRLYATLRRVYESRRQPARWAAEGIRGEDGEPAQDDRGRTADRSADRPGHLSGSPDGLFGRAAARSRGSPTRRSCAARTSFLGPTARATPNASTFTTALSFPPFGTRPSTAPS